MKNKYLITYMFKDNKVEFSIEAYSSEEAKNKLLRYTTGVEIKILNIEIMRDVE